jgi:8-oxo-dGTP diphosphatase
MEEKRPKVGVAVFIFNNHGEVLMGKRQGSHGAGKWSIPGGHLEYGEEFIDCCAREVREETNLLVTRIKPVTFKNAMHDEKHYVTLYFFAQTWTGEVKNMEPEKCDGWVWVDALEMPKPLFETMDKIVEDNRWMMV